MKCEVCGEQMPDSEILDHLRLMHPDDYGDGQPEWEDVGIETARVTIIRHLTEDNLLDVVTAVGSDGNDLPLTEALGMMRLAEDTLIRERMGEDE